MGRLEAEIIDFPFWESFWRATRDSVRQRYRRRIEWRRSFGGRWAASIKESPRRIKTNSFSRLPAFAPGTGAGGFGPRWASGPPSRPPREFLAKKQFQLRSSSVRPFREKFAKFGQLNKPNWISGRIPQKIPPHPHRRHPWSLVQGWVSWVGVGVGCSAINAQQTPFLRVRSCWSGHFRYS